MQSKPIISIQDMVHKKSILKKILEEYEKIIEDRIVSRKAKL